MSPTYQTLPRTPGWLRACLALILLGGCGGGVDSGGTGGAAPPVYASGPINGYGSVIVNGVHFDDSAPDVDIRDDDGAKLTREALKLGMVVEVRGSSITTDVVYGDSDSTASSIALSSGIVGPVDAGSIVNNAPIATTLSVLGRRIVVQPTTVFTDNATRGLATLEALTPLGALAIYIEVYGLYSAVTDSFTATRIELKPNPPENYRVSGKIVTAGANTFTIGSGSAALQINHASATERPTNLDVGNVVRVRMAAKALANGVWTANRVRSGVNSPSDGQESKVEGLIDSLASQTEFSVGGVAVTTNASTLFNPLRTGPGSTLALGMRVEVEGKFSGGVLVATEVEIESDSGDDFDFRGVVQLPSPGTTTLRINNIDIDYSNVQEWKPNGTGPDNLTAGGNVRVRAKLLDGTKFEATIIEFRY